MRAMLVVYAILALGFVASGNGYAIIIPSMIVMWLYLDAIRDWYRK